MTQIDCYANDLILVISLDEERIKSRGDDTPESNRGTSAPESRSSSQNQMAPRSPRSPTDYCLKVIQEEDEEDEDDYPFDQ